MTRLSDYAVYITTARKATYSSLSGAEKLAAVKSFYGTKGIELPSSITVTTSKRGARLTQVEKIRIQSKYISALETGEVTEELKSQLKAVNDPDAVCTFTSCSSYSDALKEFGPEVVAAKMIDALSVADNEEFHKIRKHDISAAVAVSEIPAFIKELQAIYDAAKSTESTESTESE